MPNYIFQCQDCGHEFERNLHMTDLEHDVKCPECGSERTDQQVAGFSAITEKKS